MNSIFRHYKGKFYNVLGTGKTLGMFPETLVIYNEMYGKNYTWLRPIEMFNGFANENTKRFSRREPDVYLPMKKSPNDQNINAITQTLQSPNLTCGIYHHDAMVKPLSFPNIPYVKVIGFGTHTETGNNMILFKPLIPNTFDETDRILYHQFYKCYVRFDPESDDSDGEGTRELIFITNVDSFSGCYKKE